MNPAGRLLTAQLPDAVLEELLAGNTPQDAAVRNSLAELRSTGHIIDRAATENDIVSIAVVVRGPSSGVIAAIEVLIPQYRAKVETALPLVEEAANALSTSLGASKNGIMAGVEKSSVERGSGTDRSRAVNP
jgi:DNA-binding IclR family transcriptional regulator